jgi:hypothetical protein
VNGCDATDKLKAILRRMASAKVDEGHTDPDVILDHIKAAIKDDAPLERSEIADILVGHPGGGKPKKDDLQARVAAFHRELKDLRGRGEEGGVAKLKSDIDRIASGETRTPAAKQQGPQTEEVTTLKAERDNALKNKARQNVIEKSVKALEDRIAAGDYRRAAPRESYLQTTETEQAQARLNGLRNEWEKGQRKAQMENRSPSEKIADMVVEVHRSMMLLGPNVLVKLPATAFSNIALRSLALEPTGQVWRKIFPNVAAKAASEGGAGGLVRTEGKALKETASKKTLQLMGEYARTGTHEIARLHGQAEVHSDFQSEFKLTQLIGNIHGMLKVPAAINQWSRSLTHRTASEIARLRKAGVSEQDIADHMADPAVMSEIAAKAWADGEREIFQNKNVMSEVYSNLLGNLQRVAAGNTSMSFAAKTGEKTLRWLLPITKVPSNVWVSRMSYVGGFAGAGAQWRAAGQKARADIRAGLMKSEGSAVKDALAALTPEQADSIMRNLKKQTVGMAGMAIGWFLYRNFGGLYQPGGHGGMKPEDETIRLEAFGHHVDISKQLLEHPLATAMQMGATVAWVAHRPGKNIGEGASAGFRALVQTNPFIEESLNIGKLITGQKSVSKFAGEQAASVLPGMMSWAARKLDRQGMDPDVQRAAEMAEKLGLPAVGLGIRMSSGREVKRSTKGLLDTFEAAVPGARPFVKRSPNQPPT